MSWILTRSGKRFDLFHPKPDQIDIKDIAFALALQCRFNGHCSRFYSVAEHSIIMSWNVPISLKLCALMHDATEAYIGDMVKPLKDHLSEFKRIEENIWRVIANKYGLPLELPKEVKEADLRMLATERHELMSHNTNASWSCLRNVEPYDRENYVTPNSETAVNYFVSRDPYDVFLNEFEKLTTTIRI